MAYRLQDHALDLTVPSSTDALMISVDSNQMASCTRIPKQISNEELIKLLQGAWVTNYKKLGIVWSFLLEMILEASRSNLILVPRK